MKKKIENVIQPSVSLVIPLYNNAKTASKLLKDCYDRLHKLGIQYELILCNDGSSDDSEIIINHFISTHKKVRKIVHVNNKGIAITLRDLYKEARYAYTALFSVDGGWDPKDIIALIAFAFEHESDIVIGKRIHKKYTPYRFFVSYIYNLLPQILFGTVTYDTGSIKVFKSEILQRMKFQSRSVFMEAEFLIKANKMGYTIESLPVHHYEKKHAVKSGVHFEEIKKSFFDCIRLRINIH